MSDIIVALSTPPGVGAIHVIRLSGRGSFLLAEKVINKKIPPHGVMRLANIYDDEGDIIDKALIVAFYSPRSYTGEDMVEFHIHGNPVIASALISRLISMGARLAEPGEFTKRALLSGKMSLSQVEALHEVIYGKNIESIKAATRSAAGEYEREIKAIYDDILSLASAMRADVDYPEDVELEEYGFDDRKKQFLEIMDDILEKLTILYKRIEIGQKLARGYKIVLVGAPNVGKSSLLNALLGYERAIVSDIPGTTRDFVEAMHMIGHVPVSLVDVAGIRQTVDKVEKIGVDKAKQLAKEADLLIWVVDGSKALAEDDLRVWHEFGENIRLIAVNKIDMVNDVEKALLQFKEYGPPVIGVSAKTGKGIDELVNSISDILGQHEHSPLYMSGRVMSHVHEALQYMEEARNLVETNMPEIASIDIERAARHVGAILGRADVSEDVLDKLFSTFCVGK
ncbi:MAG: tRNA uridine-5-carboxymethylaminomethyl(34) synthesis GTPase MnmE [Dictyoglomi bacterium]|nr:tRNA uridine-5-carboxymethylaminomethyl(34) synthesis GTPase MnmE [Dictyoglomota bacterium]